MGKIKHLTKVRRFFQKTPVVDLNSLKKILGKKKDYVYLLVKNMIGRGEIKKITPGFYSLHEDPVLAVFCFRPAYLGLQEALSIHDLWEQETNAVILTTRTVRTGVRTVFGNNVLIRKISPDHFFGFEYQKYGNFYVPVSDIEKTFLDLLYFNQPVDKELLKTFKKRIDQKKLKKYLKRYSPQLIWKVKRSGIFH